MGVFFQTSGLLTTIQDLGRLRFRRFGINPNGAMDKTAVRLINILVGNDENEAVLETHFPAPEILFEENALIALGGADFGAKTGDKCLENWRTYFIEKGSLLKFEKKKFGNRIYLAVKGGFNVEKWLGSASTNLTANIGGFHGRALQKGDRIKFKIQNSKFKIQNSKSKISNQLIPFYSRFPTVRVTAGAEFQLLTAFGEQKFLSETFTISKNSDRMGFRLDGEPLYLLNSKEMLSSAVNFGTIQLLPDGQMIVLMADHQTTGGYPRIAHVVEQDLPLLAQLGTNDKIAFHLIPVEEAENLILEFERYLCFFRAGCKFALEDV
jgi:antagonist of KipI